MTRDWSCPECGADWESVDEDAGVLSNAGYLHKDVTHHCTECGETWVHGKPEGCTFNRDLECPVCGGIMLYHKRAVRRGGPDTLQWKCPNCKYWTDEDIELRADNGERIAGHPEITGDMPGESGP